MRNKLAIGFLIMCLGINTTACSDDHVSTTDAPAQQPNDGNNDEEGQKPSDLPEYDAPDRTAIAAFPGAEGAGKYTTGGAEGKVYIVTSLEDSSAPGTLRHAIEQTGKRTVVFAVGGVIALKKELVIRNDHITIAGQTAPGNGICLKGNTLRINANNVIVRFIRCRMGDETQVENDAMSGYQKSYPGKSNIIIDHCSMSWSTDECASFYGNSHFTMQWCIISESLWHSIHSKDAHGYGGIWGGSPATFHHNLLAHHSNRTPRLCGSRYSNRADQEKVDVCNNVIYNWTSEGAYAGQGGSYNILNNYYKPGPATVNSQSHIRLFTAYVDDGNNNQEKGIYGKFFVNGNRVDHSQPNLSERQLTEINNANADNLSETAFVVKNNERPADDLLAESRFAILTDYNFVETANEAYESVLNKAGAWNCRWTPKTGYAIPKRDLIDQRIIKDTRQGIFSTDASRGGGFGLIDSQKDTPELWNEYTPATSELADTDQDGMPDDWEKEQGLNPNAPGDGSKYNLSESYTNLEVYLNQLVEKVFP